MTILEVGDATDIESVLDVAHSVDGPVYVRMLRKEAPRLFPAAERMALDRVRVVSEGTDVAVITSGICTEEAMRAAAALASRGLSIEHLHVTTLKPFSDERIVEAAGRAKYGVVTLENHTTIGGLGTCVAELLAEHGVGARLTRLGLFDTYAHGASRDYLMKEYDLDAMSLVQAIERMTGESFDITEGELAEVRVSDFTGEGQLEAL
jgi:transketolase